MQLFVKERAAVKGNRVTALPIENILPNPFQPRKVFDQKYLNELAESIRHNGLLQPLTVRRIPGGFKAGQPTYQLIAGERRLRACKLAQLREIPCIIMEVNDEQSAVYAVLENLQRKDLNYFEEAEGIALLIEKMSLKQEEIAERLGKSQSTIANKLRLLKIIPRQRELLLQSGLSERHARALLKLESNELRDNALSYIIARRYNVSQAEEFIDGLLYQPPKKEKGNDRIVVIKDVRLFANTINKAVMVMKQSGIDAQTIKRESDEYIEYTVKIPKAQGVKAAK